MDAALSWKVFKVNSVSGVVARRRGSVAASTSLGSAFHLGSADEVAHLNASQGLPKSNVAESAVRVVTGIF